ncbi:glycosyltransferase family 39 protein [Paracnuella aquatica]|uniref:glycosyltransferase family 39 protein n=1 Tax=Paracnuella aquatica TaxID=2268757 RepID=UPI000DEFB1B1|nr:glycosyltransferase family 39 protein [Paracnuella aquatica]RPD51750.1 hypothetical protein DRJ53_03465 [Paracnuella aquatica]
METTQLQHRNTVWTFYKHAPITTHKENSKILNQITWLFIFSGILLRLFHFFDNRSLWTDEIYLSVSIIKMNYVELAAPLLDYEQKAPLGFLWLVRTAVVFFGKGEMALRLVPLLAGIASLLLFLPLCRQFLKPMGVAVAIAIMALAPPLIYHSVEIKQYGFDMLVTIVALQLYFRYRHRTDIQSLLLWGVFGGLLYWFSFTAPFVLTPIAIAVALYDMVKRDWNRLLLCVIPFGIWMASFAVNYLLFTRGHSDDGWLVTFFKYYGGFMPFPPTSANDISWFVQTPYKMLFYPLGLLWNANPISQPLLRAVLQVPIVGMLPLVVGIISFAWQRKGWFIILAFPFLFHLLASALELYPFSERFLVYAAPFLLLFIGRGSDSVASFFSPKSALRFALPLLVLIGPLAGAAMQVATPAYLGGYKNSSQRAAFAYVQQLYQQGDGVYVYWNMAHTYQYYKPAYNLKYSAVIGKDYRWEASNTQEYLGKVVTDISQQKAAGRIWIIYNNDLDIDIGDDITKLPKWYSAEVKGGDSLRSTLSAIGSELDHKSMRDASVSLFQLNDQ